MVLSLIIIIIFKLSLRTWTLYIFNTYAQEEIKKKSMGFVGAQNTRLFFTSSTVRLTSSLVHLGPVLAHLYLYSYQLNHDFTDNNKINILVTKTKEQAIKHPWLFFN